VTEGTGLGHVLKRKTRGGTTGVTGGKKYERGQRHKHGLPSKGHGATAYITTKTGFKRRRRKTEEVIPSEGGRRKKGRRI